MNNVGRDILSSSLIALLGVWVIYETASYPSDVSMMPRLMASLILFFSIGIIIGSLLKTNKGKEQDTVEENEPIVWLVIIPFLLLWIASIAFVPTIGFYVTMGMLWLAITSILEGQNLRFLQIAKHIGSCVGVILVLYLTFEVLVGVPTPIGIFR